MTDAAEPPVPPPAGAADDHPEDAAAPKRPRGPVERDEGSEPDAGDDDVIWAAELAHETVLNAGRDVRTGNIHNGNFIVEGDYVEGAGSKRERAPASMDISADAEAAQRSFVAPPHFAELKRRLQEDRVVVLAGGGCGNRTTAVAALLAASCGPILELPASVTADALLEALRRIYRNHRTAGVLIESIDADTLRGVADFDLRRLRQSLANGGAVVLTTRTSQGQPVRASGLCVVDALPPDAEAVVRAVARTIGATEDALARAQAALCTLEPPVAPSTAAQLIELAHRGDDAPEDLAAQVSWQSTALDGWVAEYPTAQHVASLTAAAVLDGAPSTDVEAEALRLAKELEGELEPSSEPRRFGAPERGWPAGVVAIGRDAFATHFGRQQSEVVKICPPHRREQIVGYLWDRLGADFRGPYLDWLRSLPNHRSDRIRSGAAITAGAFFVAEPVIAERELLRPWASDGRRWQVGCAGLALGVPVVLGEDPAPARALANHWVRSANRNQRRVAIAAYGGLLGAWDAGSAAPEHLWRVGIEDPELRRMADVSLGFLVAAGADAGWARGTAIAVIAAEVEQRPARRRSYELLPIMIGQLASGSSIARESLAALLGETESGSLALLAGLFARAFDAPMGHASARRALLRLLDGLAANRVERRQVNQLIRAMKAQARPGRLAALGSQIERTLNAERRGDGPRATVARSVHATFYSPSPRRSLA